jgi:hypothetical protein
MSHDKKCHNSKCHPASCIRLLEYLALFCVLKSVGAAPFPSSPARPAFMRMATAFSFGMRRFRSGRTL